MIKARLKFTEFVFIRTNDDVLESEERDAKSPSEDRDAKSPTEDRDCKSPTEASYGDDESKEEEEPRKRRTRRNVRVEEGELFTTFIFSF